MFRWKTKSKVDKILKFVEHLQKIYIYLPLRGLKRLKSKIYELKIWFFNTESTPWSYLVFHSFLTFCNFQHFLLLIILIIILRSGAVASRRPHTKVVARCALRTGSGTGHIQSLYFFKKIYYQCLYWIMKGQSEDHIQYIELNSNMSRIPHLYPKSKSIRVLSLI
jgi:hypothetical protein